MDVLFADDAFLLIAADSLEVLGIAMIAGRNVAFLARILEEFSLGLSAEKCRNIVFDSRLLTRGVFRGGTQTAYPSSKDRLAEQHREEGR